MLKKENEEMKRKIQKENIKGDREDELIRELGNLKDDNDEL